LERKKAQHAAINVNAEVATITEKRRREAEKTAAFAETIPDMLISYHKFVLDTRHKEILFKFQSKVWDKQNAELKDARRKLDTRAGELARQSAQLRARRHNEIDDRKTAEAEEALLHAFQLPPNGLTLEILSRKVGVVLLGCRMVLLISVCALQKRELSVKKESIVVDDNRLQKFQQLEREIKALQVSVEKLDSQADKDKDALDHDRVSFSRQRLCDGF